MAERSRGVSFALVEVVMLASAYLLGGAGTTDPRWMALAVAGTLLGSLVTMPAAGQSGFTLGAMVTAALPVTAADGRQVFDVPSALAVVVASLALAALAAVARGTGPGSALPTVVRRLLGSSVYVGAFFALDGVVPVDALDGWRAFVVFSPAAVAWMISESAAAWLLAPGARGDARWTAALGTLRDVDAFAILVSSGALFALAFDALSWWAIVVAALPFLFARGAFSRFRDEREAYTQTMRALARIPEVGGHTPAGHAARTAETALLLGTYLGLRPGRLRELEYGALMHDIGRLALNEPSVVRQGYTESDIAAWGAELIGEVPYLERVADIVARREEPYRYPGVERSDEVPLLSRIVKVASAYDAALTDGLTPLEALERLHEGSVYEYDPDIVSALRAVLTRRRALMRR